MRKVASHFWLRPDGTVGKFPIITFNELNQIVEVRERNTFEEEPGLELVNGFLIPGFVDFAPASLENAGEVDLQKYLNRQIIGGTIVLGLCSNLFKRVKKKTVKGLFVVESGLTNVGNQQTAFDTLRAEKGGLDQLVHFTRKNAITLGVHDDYGTLEVGKSPGLLSIRKMDYERFCVSADSKIRIVI